MKIDDSDGREPIFTLRFHGVRGSFPVPGPEVVHFGGNTSCIVIESGGFRLIFDCGTGLVAAGSHLQSLADTMPVRVLLLVSHLHHDHTMGWPFFKPLYDARATVHVRGPGSDGHPFQDIFESSFAHPYFPVSPAAMPARRTFDTLSHGDVLTWASPEATPSVG